MTPAQPQSVSLMCSHIEAQVRFFVDALGFTVRTQDEETAVLHREGLVVTFTAARDDVVIPATTPLHLFVGVKRMDLAWQRDRRLHGNDVDGPKLLDDMTYRYATSDPSNNPLILHATLYRGQRPRRVRGKTRRMRPKSPSEDVPTTD